MISKDLEILQKEIEELRLEIKVMRVDQDIIIKAFDILQSQFKKRYQEFHINKKRKWWEIKKEDITRIINRINK